MATARVRATRDNDRGEAPTQAERTAAIRAGWNDAAWGRPPRAIPPLATYYEIGYAGGLVFRRRNRGIVG
jgi:hypothetical protein